MSAASSLYAQSMCRDHVRPSHVATANNALNTTFSFSNPNTTLNTTQDAVGTHLSPLAGDTVASDINYMSGSGFRQSHHGASAVPPHDWARALAMTKSHHVISPDDSRPRSVNLGLRSAWQTLKKATDTHLEARDATRRGPRKATTGQCAFIMGNAKQPQLLWAWLEYECRCMLIKDVMKSFLSSETPGIFSVVH